MTRDETAVMLYVDGDVGRLVAVERALAHQGASVATAVSAVHMGRLLQRTPTVRIAAVDANSVDVVAIAVLLARAETDVGLVVLTDEPEQRARLARERGVVAVFSRQGSADAIASRVRSALAVPSIERVTLSTILRLAAAVRATFTLRIDSSDALSQTHGVIWVDNGQIVHAELGDLVGANAVVAMLAQKERAIGLERETRAKMRTVHFDIDVFLSSFDLPDDEPEIELVDDGLSATSLSAARLRAHEVSENDGTFGVLAVSGAIDGVVSAGLLAERVLGASRERAQAGAAGDIEQSLAESELAVLHAGLTAAEQRRELGLMGLRDALDLPADAPIALATPLAEPSSVPTPQTLAKRALEARADLEAIRKRIDLLVATEERLEREVFPRVGGYLGVEQSPLSPTIGIVGVSVELPVAQRNQGPRARAAAQREGENDRLVIEARRIVRDVHAAFVAFEARRRELKTLTETALPTAQRTVDLVESGWRSGRFDIFRVTSATRDLARVRALRLDALEAAWMERIALDRAVGGGLDT